MGADLETLVQTLLFEGYALYPYTPQAIKNATPTPFGIVYPPAYAAEYPSTFDRARMECIAVSAPDTRVSASVRFLLPSGEGHRAEEQRLDLSAPGEAVPFSFGDVRGRVRLRVEPLDGDLVRVFVCAHNATDVPSGLTRPEALRYSLLSCHITASIEGGRFVSPLARDGAEGEAATACRSENTYPVLVGEADEHVLGAAIILPDHPQLAPESKTSMFDGTEIEEALMLHVLALSDAEREAIADSDPAVRAMVDRVAAGATAEDLRRLHGRVEVRDPPTFTEPGPGRGPAASVPGETSTLVDGVAVRPGSRVILRPDAGRTTQDGLLAGRAATVERIYRAYDDKIHLGVTVDDDPGQELMREIGRFLFFDPTEVEVIAP